MEEILDDVAFELLLSHSNLFSCFQLSEDVIQLKDAIFQSSDLLPKSHYSISVLLTGYVTSLRRSTLRCDFAHSRRRRQSISTRT